MSTDLEAPSSSGSARTLRDMLRDLFGEDPGGSGPVRAPTVDRWPTVAEVAVLIAAWLPEATEIAIDTDEDGVPGALIGVPGLSRSMLWYANDHESAYAHAPEEPLTEEEDAAWAEAAERLYGDRDTNPAAVWRWRVGQPPARTPDDPCGAPSVAEEA